MATNDKRRSRTQRKRLSEAMKKRWAENGVEGTRKKLLVESQEIGSRIAQLQQRHEKVKAAYQALKVL